MILRVRARIDILFFEVNHADKNKNTGTHAHAIHTTYSRAYTFKQTSTNVKNIWVWCVCVCVCVNTQVNTSLIDISQRVLFEHAVKFARTRHACICQHTSTYLSIRHTSAHAEHTFIFAGTRHAWWYLYDFVRREIDRESASEREWETRREIDSEREWERERQRVYVFVCTCCIYREREVGWD